MRNFHNQIYDLSLNGEMPTIKNPVLAFDGKPPKELTFAVSGIIHGSTTSINQLVTLSAKKTTWVAKYGNLKIRLKLTIRHRFLGFLFGNKGHVTVEYSSVPWVTEHHEIIYPHVRFDANVFCHKVK